MNNLKYLVAIHIAARAASIQNIACYLTRNTMRGKKLALVALAISHMRVLSMTACAFCRNKKRSPCSCRARLFANHYTKSLIGELFILPMRSFILGDDDKSFIRLGVRTQSRIVAARRYRHYRSAGAAIRHANKMSATARAYAN